MEPNEPEIQRTTDSEAMARLRDRTDELELIISSLTIFALFTVPGWLFNRFADIYTHLSTSFVIAGTLSLTLLAGVCYGLAACFVVHLMARAYWVGLIGLRTAFPTGINWGKTPGLGPLSRQYFQDTLPDLDSVIQSTDRLASSLFAVISMLTLGVLWLGTILIATIVASGAIGSRFGQTNAGIGLGTAVLLVVFGGAPVLVYLLDAQLAARVARLRKSRGFAGLVGLLRRIAGLAFPQRLILPVQLTLQSNTRPVIFYLALVLVMAGIVVVGNIRMAAWRNFTLSGEFTYLDSDQVSSGFRSAHYEDMSSSLDRFRGWPRIDSFHQKGSFVRLFLPYQPLRDNLVLDKLCGSADQAPDRVNCLRQLWAVTIEGRPVSLADFATAERADIGMRGLIGLVPLTGVAPGMREIVVVWYPDAADEVASVDDRYSNVNFTYVIPIAFAPEFELTLP